VGLEEVKSLPVEMLVVLGAEVLLLEPAGQAELGHLVRVITAGVERRLQTMVAVAVAARALSEQTVHRQ